MKCEKCGYDDGGSGDMAHVCPPLRTQERESYRYGDHPVSFGLFKREQKPVAWRFRSGTLLNREVHWRYIETLEGSDGILGLEPLYNKPQKPWVDLTDEEIESAWRNSCTIDNGKGANLTNQPFYHLSRLLEAKLKEKNT